MQLNALSSRAILRRCKPVAPLARKNEALISAMSCKSRPVDSCQRQPGLCDENDDQPRFLRSLINEAPAAQARATRHASQPTEPFFRCALSTPLGWLWAASEYGRAGQGRAGQGKKLREQNPSTRIRHAPDCAATTQHKRKGAFGALPV